MSLASALMAAQSAEEEDRLQAAARQREAELAALASGAEESLSTPGAVSPFSPITPTPADSPRPLAAGQTPMTSGAPRTARKHTTVAPSFTLPPSHPLASQCVAASASSPAAAASKQFERGFTSNLRATDPASLAQYLEEARLAYQYGKYENALTVYSYLEGLKVTVPNLSLHIGCCRRLVDQCPQAIASLTAQLKVNEQLGIHALGRQTGNGASTSLEHGAMSSASNASGAYPNDPDHIASSLVCEWERCLCWEALHESENASRSSAQLRRMMDTTSRGVDVDNTYACWMAMAKWLATHGYDANAKLALEQARWALLDDSATIDDSDTDEAPFVNDHHWLLLSAYVAWSLGEYDAVASIAHYFAHPSGPLIPSDGGAAGQRALESSQTKLHLLHIGSCLSSDTDSLSMETASRLIGEIVSRASHHSSETLATTLHFKAASFLVRGSLRQAVATLKQALVYETRATEERAATHGAMAALSTSTAASTRFPFFGPLAVAGLVAAANTPLPPTTTLCMYDLRRTVDRWTTRAGARGGASLPPNFEVIQSGGGVQPMHASSRYLCVLIDFYSELLLKYGLRDPRLLFYRANLFAALGNTRMQLHDLEILLATSPSWYSQYASGQTSCDWPDFQSLHSPLSRVCVVNLLNLHRVATAFGATLFDKNVPTSASRVVALQRRYYSDLSRIPLLSQQAANTSAAVAAAASASAATHSHSSGRSPRAHHRRMSTGAGVHDAEVASIGARAALHQRGPSGSSLPSRSSTSLSGAQLITGQSVPPTNRSAAPADAATEWDSTPVSGLLDCEEPLYYEAIVADLTRQQVSPFDSLHQTDARLNKVQETFENILNHLKQIAATNAATAAATAAAGTTSNTNTSTAAAPLSPLLTMTSLICSQGLALLHCYRLRLPSARHASLDGLALIWTEVDRVVSRRSERARLRKSLKGDASESGAAGHHSIAEETPTPTTQTRPGTAATPSTVSLTAQQILASNAPFHIKALKLTAPLLVAMSAADQHLHAEWSDEASEGTIYSEASYWGSERSMDTHTSSLHRSVKGGSTSGVGVGVGGVGAVQTSLEWLDPSRLLLNHLRRNCAILLSLIGISYMLEANTDTSLLLFYRALAVDPNEYLAHLYLFYHHLRFSPLNLALKHFIAVYASVPFFIPNLDSISLSPMRYPLEADTAFSGSFVDPSAEEDLSHNPFDATNSVDASAADSTSHMRRSSLTPIDPTLAYPFPRCLHRCLTSRLTERPHIHTTQPEMTLLLQSLSSHMRAVKQRNEVAIKLHRQHELVERFKTERGLSGARKVDPEANQMAALATTTAATTLNEDAPADGLPLILSLQALHPTHPLHPSHLRQKKGFEEELRALKPNKPTGAAPSKPVGGGRSTKVKKDATSTAASKSAGGNGAASKKAAADAKVTPLDLNDPSLVLPACLHVDHRAYQPSSGSLSGSWTALQWYKESLKLLAAYDKHGVMLCLLKCLHLDIDYCASLNYVLSLLETNLTESNVTFASVQMMRDARDIDALEAAAASGGGAGGGSGEDATDSPSSGASASAVGINKHSYESMSAMFGRDKVLPIVWDIFIRAKQFEELFGNVDLACSDYAYAGMFMQLGDVLWRRGLLRRARGNIPLALVDIGDAIGVALTDHAFLDQIVREQPTPVVAKKPAATAEKPHMTDKEKKELAAANALAANAHTPEASLALVRKKLEAYHLVRALLLFNQGKFAPALTDTAECLARNARNPTALRLLSLGQTHLAQYEDAIVSLEKYLDLVPRDHGSRLRLANLYSFTQSHEKAARQFDRLLTHAPTNAEVIYAKGLGFYRQHMWHDAHDMFQTCIRLQPKFWLARMRLGEVLERLDRYEQSLETLKAALEGSRASHASPSEDNSTESRSEGFTRVEMFELEFIHRTIGRVYLSQAQQAYMAHLARVDEERKSQAKKKKDMHMRGTLELAGASPTAASPLDGGGATQTESKRQDVWGDVVPVAASPSPPPSEGPSSAPAVTFVGKCLYQAFLSLQQAVQSTPGTEDAESFYLLALSLLFLVGNRLKDPNGRIWSLLERVVELESNHTEARFLRGFLLQREGRIAECTLEYDRVLALDPDHLLALQARAYLYFQGNEHHHALETYTRMMNHPGPLRAVAYANRGLVHLANRDYYVALNDLDYAISAAPHHALAFLYRAETHKSLSFMNESIADYRTAVVAIKAKIEEADNERRQIEARRLKTPASASPPPTAASTRAHAGAPAAFTFDQPTVGANTAPSSSGPDTLTLPVDSSRSVTPSHARHPSSSSMHLTLPEGFANVDSAISASDAVAPPPHAHARTSSLARWRSIRDLVQNHRLRISLSPPSVSLVVNAADSQADFALLSPSMPLPASSPFAGSPLGVRGGGVARSSVFDLESLSLVPIQGVEHFRMVGHPLATAFQSEVGLTQKDLDSVNNSLGILLHQRAGMKKKAVMNAQSQRMTDASQRSGGAGAGAASASMSMTLAAQMVGTGAGGGSAPFSTSTAAAVAVADAEDDEALSYFTTGSSQFQSHYNRALIFLEKGALHTALAEFRHAVEAAPKFANAHNNYGVVLQKLGHLDQASTHYAEALRLTSQRHLIAGFNLANTKTSTHQYQEAVRLYTVFLKRVQRLKRDASHETSKQQKAKQQRVGEAIANKDASATNGNAHTAGMRYESLHLEEHHPAANKAEFMPAFQRGLVEHQAREDEERAAAEERMRSPRPHASKSSSTTTGGGHGLASTSPSLLQREPVVSLASQEDANLVALLPLALNNRAICFQNLGRYEAALAGYTAALALAPRLTYIKFNRAHLYMVMGNCFDALEDIRDYSREKAARNFQQEKKEQNAAAAAGGAAEPPTANAIERELAAPSAATSTGDSAELSESLEYLSNFYDYCKRYQWGLGVATKDLLTGIRCMPIMSHLNLTVPTNPIGIFNPHMLHDPDSADWRRLRELVAKMVPAELLRTQHESALANGIPATDVKLRAKLAPTTADSACVTHVKLALSMQIDQRFDECLDALLKALYLLPPSSVFLEQQKLDFARRHKLNVSGGGGGGAPPEWTLDDAPASSTMSDLDPALHAELASDLHEILVLWRARLQVYLTRYAEAVADLEFYVNAIVAAADVNKTIYRGKDGRLRRNASRLHGTDDESSDGEDFAIILPTGSDSTTPLIGTSRDTSRAASRAHDRERSSASVASWRTDSRAHSRSFSTAGAAGGVTAASHSPDGEMHQRNRLALFAHRQQVRHARVLCYLGSIYHLQRRDTDALRVYTLAIQADRDNFYALLNRSLVSRLQGRYSNAIADLFDVLRIVTRLDEQQRGRERDRRTGVEVPTDPLWPGPSSKPWQPEIETGLPPSATSTLRLTTAQSEVHSVLLQYGEVLKLNPQESWDRITGLQGQLAIAVDRVLAERAEKKKKNVDVTTAGAVLRRANLALHDEGDANDSDGGASSDEAGSPRAQKLSAADAAVFFREQLDAATEKLMDHLIDPKEAREKEMAHNAGIPAAGAGSHLAGARKSTLATASGSSSAPVPTQTKVLDDAFTTAFANLNSLIQSQLPRKALARPSPTPRVEGMPHPSEMAQGLATARAEHAVNSAYTLSGAADSVPHHAPSTFTFEAEPTPPVAEARDFQASLSAGGGVFAPNTPLSALITNLNARAKAAHAESGYEETAASSATSSRSQVGEKAPPPQGKKGPSGRSGPRKSTSVAASATAAPPSKPPTQRSRSGRGPRPPVSGAPAASLADDDAAFLASLDPSLSSAARTRLLEDRRLKRVAEAKHKFAGAHTRGSSFYGLLESDHLRHQNLATSHDASTTLAKQAARHANQLARMEREEEDEEDEFSSFDEDE